MSLVLLEERLTLSDVKVALAKAWSRATSADPRNWSELNAAWGQCAITALIVQDYFGGTLLRGEVGLISHYWNVLSSGREIDLTRHQFTDDVEIANVAERTRESLLSNPDTAHRYFELAEIVRASMRRGG